MDFSLLWAILILPLGWLFTMIRSTKSELYKAIDDAVKQRQRDIDGLVKRIDDRIHSLETQHKETTAQLWVNIRVNEKALADEVHRLSEMIHNLGSKTISGAETKEMIKDVTQTIHTLLNDLDKNISELKLQLARAEEREKMRERNPK